MALKEVSRDLEVEESIDIDFDDICDGLTATQQDD